MFINPGEALPAFEWNDVLAVSASRRIKHLQGCGVEAGLVYDTDGENDFFKEIATAENHVSFGFYPHHMRWSDARELAFDMFLGDYFRDNSAQQVWYQFFDQIGMACDCHPKYDYYCVVDFG